MLSILLSSILLVSISVGCDMAVVPGDGTDRGLGTVTPMFDSPLLMVPIDFIDNERLLGFADFANTSGEQVVELDTSLDRLFFDIAQNARGHVLMLYDDSIEVYETESALRSNTPDRVVTSTALTFGARFAMDRGRDELYVRNLTVGENNELISAEYLVFEATGSTDFVGDVDPVRVIESPAFATTGMVADTMVSPKDELYLLVNDFNGDGAAEDQTLLVYENASTLDTEGTPIDPDRIISFPQFNPGFGGLQGFTVDALDNLIVSATRQDGVGILNPILKGVITVPNASSLNGDIMDPDFIAHNVGFGSGINGIGGFDIDDLGNAYISLDSGIGVYENVVGRDGIEQPDRVFTDADTTVFSPDHILIVK